MSALCTTVVALFGLAGPPPTSPAAESRPSLAVAPAPAVTARPEPRPEPRPDDGVARWRRKDAWSWRFFGVHYGTGVAVSLAVLPGTYALAGVIGQRGKGLGPVVGALLLAGFAPPLLTYTAQWAAGRSIARRRERVWPGLLVSQLGHLGVFAGAILGGADFRNWGHASAVVLSDALVVTGLGSLTAELTRRRPGSRRSSRSDEPELSFRRHERLWSPRRLEIVVPLMEVEF